MDHSLDCHDVDVDPEVLHDKEDISFNGVVLKFSNMIPPHGQVYKSEKVGYKNIFFFLLFNLFKRGMRQLSASTTRPTASLGL